MSPRLFIVIPCYNEEAVLPITAPLFLQKLRDLSAAGKIAEDSRVLFVNDGSRDKTWQIISELAKSDEHYIGISQSRNRGHQNAVLAGLMEARDKCDITISIDCDGQDDINAMDKMVDAYLDGCEVVYGVRSSRETDTFFKRFTAESFYKFLAAMGAEVKRSTSTCAAWCRSWASSPPRSATPAPSAWRARATIRSRRCSASRWTGSRACRSSPCA